MVTSFRLLQGSHYALFEKVDQETDVQLFNQPF